MGLVLWFTGLSGSGKTTICNELLKSFPNALLIDGDIIRKQISSDLGYTKPERDEHIKRVIYYIKEKQIEYNIILASLLSPTKTIRDKARKELDNFIEIYVKCPIEVCISRNVKGLYKERKNMVGLDIPYEEPLNPELILETDKYNLEQCISIIKTYLKNYKSIKYDIS